MSRSCAVFMLSKIFRISPTCSRSLRLRSFLWLLPSALPLVENEPRLDKIERLLSRKLTRWWTGVGGRFDGLGCAGVTCARTCAQVERKRISGRSDGRWVRWVGGWVRCRIDVIPRRALRVRVFSLLRGGIQNETVVNARFAHVLTTVLLHVEVDLYMTESSKP